MFEITRRVRNRLRGWVHSQKKSDDAVDVGVSVSFTPEVLSELCRYHVRRAYHPRAQLTAEWHVLTTEFYEGYMSPGHPSAGLDYAVVVRTRDRVYTYRVDGTGEVFAHNLRKGRKVTDLPLPDLFAVSSVGMGKESEAAVR